MYNDMPFEVNSLSRHGQPQVSFDKVDETLTSRRKAWIIKLPFLIVSLFFLTVTLVAHFGGYPRFSLLWFEWLQTAVGVLLLGIGFAIVYSVLASPERGLVEPILSTQGPYALCRFPLYGSMAFLVVPGLGLVLHSWAVLTAPLFMYFLARYYGQAEERVLSARFGEAYTRYAEKVGQLLPRFWRFRAAYWYPMDTGPIEERLWAIRVGSVNMFVYRTSIGLIAIDTTIGGKRLAREWQKTGLDTARVSHVFLTHSDADHTGGLDLFPNAKVYLGTDEIPLVTRQRPRLGGIIKVPSLSRPFEGIQDGQELAIGDTTLQAIATPGHTPGSMSYLINGQILLTGDAVRLLNGRAWPFFRWLCMDPKAAIRSLHRLAMFSDLTRLCTAHHGCTDQPVEALKPWADRKDAQ